MPFDDDIAPIFLWLYFLFSYKGTFWCMDDMKLKVDIMKNPHNHNNYFDRMIGCPLIGHYTNFWPLLIWTLLPNLTFYLIVQGFHRTYATGAACQQRTLTPPDPWSCPTLGLACVLMSRPISPELVLSPEFWISNTPRYFSFASKREIVIA